MNFIKKYFPDWSDSRQASDATLKCRLEEKYINFGGLQTDFC